MAMDTTAPRSRRALLTAAAGAAAATAVQAIARPLPAKAADGDYVRVGGWYTGSIVTKITTANSTALEGASGSGWGVYGFSGSSAGVYGYSSSGSGVYGISSSSSGVDGTSFSTDHPATVGRSQGNSTGLLGYSGAYEAVPAARAKTGVLGIANQDAGSVGVSGISALGRGGRFAGKKAQLRLFPSTDATHPASGARGDLFVDKSGRLWFCTGGTTWKQLA